MSSEEDLSRKIVKWLSEQGYPLEMRVAQKLTKDNLSVTKSDFYTDFETDKSREIDVVSRSYDYARCKAPDGNDVGEVELEIYCMFECKSTEKPWVIFKSSADPASGFESPLRNRAANSLFIKSDNQRNGTFLSKLADSASSGITQAFTSGKDLPYEAVMGALKAAEAKIRKELQVDKLEGKEENTTTNNFFYKHAICTFPIVVTDTRLFECYLTETGEIEVREIEYGAVNIRYPRRKERFERGTLVYVFRESSFDVFLSGLREFREALVAKLPELTK